LVVANLPATAILLVVVSAAGNLLTAVFDPTVADLIAAGLIAAGPSSPVGLTGVVGRIAAVGLVAAIGLVAVLSLVVCSGCPIAPILAVRLARGGDLSGLEACCLMLVRGIPPRALVAPSDLAAFRARGAGLRFHRQGYFQRRVPRLAAGSPSHAVRPVRRGRLDPPAQLGRVAGLSPMRGRCAPAGRCGDFHKVGPPRAVQAARLLLRLPPFD